jgi:hypothetical protein
MLVALMRKQSSRSVPRVQVIPVEFLRLHDDRIRGDLAFNSLDAVAGESGFHPTPDILRHRSDGR